jgi:hypothetical protein
MPTPVTIPKERIVSKLRDRGLNARADWVQRELPDEVDTDKHASLLSTLNLDVAHLSGGDGA